MDQWDGIIIGASIAAVVTVVVSKFLEKSPIGGGTPAQSDQPAYQSRGGYLYTPETCPLPMDASPVVQTTPITEAAYNVGYTQYGPAFGQNENQPNDGNEAILMQ